MESDGRIPNALNDGPGSRIHGRVRAEDSVVELSPEPEAPVAPLSFEELFPMLDRAHAPEGEEIAFVSPMPNDFAGHSIMIGRPILESDIRSTLVEANFSIWWPTRSPDGSKIAYQDGGSIYVVDLFTHESSKVADGNTAEWLDNDTLIVTPE